MRNGRRRGPGRLRRAFGKARRLGFDTLLRAQWAVLWAGVLVWRRPTGQLVARAGAEPVESASPVAPPGVHGLARAERRAEAERPAEAERLVEVERLPEARRLAEAVELVARRGPVRAACLVRAVALQRLLRARGIPPGRVRVGVRRGESDGRGESGLHAHAWVELGGRVLGDSPRHVATFRPLTDVRLREDDSRSSPTKRVGTVRARLPATRCFKEA